MKRLTIPKMLLSILVILLVTMTLTTNVFALGEMTEDGYYKVSEQEMIDFANKLAKLEGKLANANEDIAKHKELVVGLEKEISIKDEMITVLKKSNNKWEMVLEESYKRSDKVIEKANETIALQNKLINKQDEIINEYEKANKLTIFEKLKLISYGALGYAAVQGLL